MRVHPHNYVRKYHLFHCNRVVENNIIHIFFLCSVFYLEQMVEYRHHKYNLLNQFIANMILTTVFFVSLLNEHIFNNQVNSPIVE